MISYNSSDIASALLNLHQRVGPDKNEFFSSEEILSEINDKEINDFDDDELYRGLVASVNNIHKDPEKYLENEFVDVIRQKTGSGFKGWEFRLVTEDQIGAVYEESGFEGNASHEANHKNLGLWNQNTEDKPDLETIISDYIKFKASKSGKQEEWKFKFQKHFEDEIRPDFDLNYLDPDELDSFIDKLGSKFGDNLTVPAYMIGGAAGGIIWDGFAAKTRDNPDEAAEVLSYLFDEESSLENRLERFKEFYGAIADQKGASFGPLLGLATWLLMFAYPKSHIFYKISLSSDWSDKHTDELDLNQRAGYDTGQYVDIRNYTEKLEERLSEHISDTDMLDVQDLLWYSANYWLPSDIEAELESIKNNAESAYGRLFALKCYLELKEKNSKVEEKLLKRKIGEKFEKEKTPSRHKTSYTDLGMHFVKNYDLFQRNNGKIEPAEKSENYIPAMRNYVDQLWTQVTKKTNYFVVSHNSRPEQLESEYLQAPYTSSSDSYDDSYQPSHDLSKLEKEDIVLHYKSNKFIGYSEVTKNPEIREKEGEKEFYLKVDINRFQKPRSLAMVKDILMEERSNVEKYYVLNSEGGKAEGYLKLLTKRGAQHVINYSNKETNYFWVNAKPSRWKVSSIEDGGTAFYTAYNRKGNKRKNYSAFESASAGDKVVFYESQPSQKVVATGEIVEGLHEEEHEDYDEPVEGVSMKYGEAVEEITWGELKSNKELSEVLPLDNFQGSLFKISKEAYEKVLEHGSLTEKNKERLEKYVSSPDFDLDIPDSLYFEDKTDPKAEIEASLNSGKNIIFTGPPGTGKTKLAKDISKQVSGEKEGKVGYKEVEGTVFTTATADWTAFDTIGGYMPSNGNSDLEFNAGQFLKCFREENGRTTKVTNNWLVIDEINRSDIDKAFGQLFSVLSGDSVELPYTKKVDESDEHVEIRRVKENIDEVAEKDNIYPVTDSWRLIATMNTMDKTSLYEMSYAFMRRFNFIHVDVPSLEDGEHVKTDLLEPGSGYAKVWKRDHPETVKVLEEDDFYKEMSVLWYKINQTRSIGPSIILDMLRYLNARNSTDETALTDAITSLVFPQMEGLTKDDLKEFISELYKKESLSDEEDRTLNLIEKKKLKKTAESFFNRDLDVEN